MLAVMRCNFFITNICISESRLSEECQDSKQCTLVTADSVCRLNRISIYTRAFKENYSADDHDRKCLLNVYSVY